MSEKSPERADQIGLQEEQHDREKEDETGGGGREEEGDHIYVGPNWVMISESRAKIAGQAAHKGSNCLSVYGWDMTY